MDKTEKALERCAKQFKPSSRFLIGLTLANIYHAKGRQVFRANAQALAFRDFEIDAIANQIEGMVPLEENKAKLARMAERGTFWNVANPDGSLERITHPCVFSVELPTQDGYGRGKVLAQWSGATNGYNEPPKIGERVRVKVNSIGEGTVIAYFVESGWLGVKVQVDNPPKWWLEQNPTRPACTVFGSEIGRVE